MSLLYGRTSLGAGVLGSGFRLLKLGEFHGPSMRSLPFAAGRGVPSWVCKGQSKDSCNHPRTIAKLAAPKCWQNAGTLQFGV